MSDYGQSDVGRDSDIDIIIEDDGSESGENNDGQFADDQLTAGDARGDKAGDKDKSGKKPGQADDEPGCPYLPRLKTSIIQVVLNINAELIRLCNEYQNNSLMDDPQLVMYQMRLQSNLAYLASVADHYMDPTRSMPDLRPLPRPTLPSCQGTSIMAKLSHAREVYSAYARAWAEQQMELSKRAKTALREEEKTLLSSIDHDHMHEEVEELLKQHRVVYDKSGEEPVAPETFTPFPPFKLPEGTRLPPGLPRWSFENNIATPSDSNG
ncbi:hypothetical protein IWW55_000556 [Coemansia sp. RSA 2706]|nr:hypothetical protein IWW55_000556 [Coemansia sp. RSA 2706]KAJ2314687.1 hypothetical protein IWW54_000780 [Coemansia sp. RSA 2705]KAJ2318352.1 hypothetical protein IWW52_002607 [Coemansia sp. RSA 2704]KAJ2329551.1 hypothetical protein IWW51_000535 [Coemansia sp. RSA 2702]KAJ2368734.1 hypothetical protein H4S01_001424 [Coemansia sp. RSA 2610]KAJ2392711.1 hypothetical protein H4S02_000633 [Coemansia sp. RSA 2611]KAJ2739586.1 hypothetical protein H4R23_000359 [Coemansia sp. Cherry 401B]